MPVIINGNLLEPAPFVDIQKSVEVLGNQNKIGQTYTLTIRGHILSWKGSPNGGSLVGHTGWGGPFGAFWQLSAPAPDETTVISHGLYSLEFKQRAIEELFSINGALIEFESPDGSAPLKAYIKNAKVNWPEGTWAQHGTYEVVAECDLLYLNGNPVQDAPFSNLIQQASENWNIQIGEVVKTFNIQHDISAQGKIGFDQLGNVTQPAWMNARDFILDQLVLGWNGLSNYSNTSGDYIFKNSALASGMLNLGQYSPYNYSLVETVDELNGSVNITENWILSPQSSGSHQYVVNTRRIVDDPYTTVVSNIQGTIHGYYDGLFNYDQRIAAAEYTWAQLAGPTGLLNLINSTYSGYNYNVQPRQGEIDYNINEGTLTYNYEFSNTLYEQDAFDQWTISKKVSADSYLTTYAIAGTVKGRRYDGDTDVKAAFNRAYVWFSTLSGSNYTTLYNRILSSTYYPEASEMGVQPDPISKSIDINEGEGVIGYSLEYNNRANDNAYPADIATDEYQISKHFDRNDGITHYTVNGTVKGLNVSDYANARKSKFDNASGYFYTYVVPNLYSRVQSYYNVSLPDTTPMVTEVGLSVGEGAINYTYEYTNIFPPILPGAYSEHIEIAEVNYNQQVQLTAQIPVPGRRPGSVIQDVQTTVVKSRTITISTVLGPTGDLGGNLANAFASKPSYDSFVYQLQPANSYCNNWSDNYDFRYGHYSLTAEFIYE